MIQFQYLFLITLVNLVPLSLETSFADDNLPSCWHSARVKLLGGDAIGGVKMGVTPAEVVSILGKPSIKRKAQKEENIWTMVWGWNAHSSEIGFSGSSPKKMKVVGISIAKPSKLKTKKGIGIGSSFGNVSAAYPDGRIVCTQLPECKIKNYLIDGDCGMTFDSGEDGVGAIYWGADTGP
jgi:hypothetical protein